MEPPADHPLFRPSQPPPPRDNGQPASGPITDEVSGNGGGAAEPTEAFAPVPESDWAPPAEPDQNAPEPEPVPASVPAAENAAMSNAPTSAEQADYPPPTIGHQWEGSDRPVTSTPNTATPEDLTRADGGEHSAEAPWQRQDRAPVAEHTDDVDPMASLEPELSEEERIEDERRQRIAELQHRWLVTQAQILDDPRDAVREAGLLIGDALQFLTTTYSGHRDRIERSWKNDDSMTTDELRDTMRRYRALFQHVLSVTRIPGQ